MNKLLFRDLRERWAEIGQYKATHELKFEIELFKKIFKIFQTGPSYFIIFNLPKAKIEYVSPDVKKVLGYSPDKYNLKLWIDIIHNDDISFLVEFEDKIIDFKMKLPLEKLTRYKTRYNYRIKKKNNKYTYILQQSITIQTDKDGAVLRNLIVYTDISEYTNNNKMSLSFIGLENEPSFMNVETKGKYISTKNNFTGREKEIVNLISQNKTSKEIAEKLNISIHTVKTHRKNINKKSETSNVLELVTKALKNGWI